MQARVVVGWLSDVMVRYSREFPRDEGLEDGVDPYHVANCVQLGHKQCVQPCKCYIKIPSSHVFMQWKVLLGRMVQSGGIPWPLSG